MRSHSGNTTQHLCVIGQTSLQGKLEKCNLLIRCIAILNNVGVVLLGRRRKGYWWANNSWFQMHLQVTYRTYSTVIVIGICLFFYYFLIHSVYHIIVISL